MGNIFGRTRPRRKPKRPNFVQLLHVTKKVKGTRAKCVASGGVSPGCLTFPNKNPQPTTTVAKYVLPRASQLGLQRFDALCSCCQLSTCHGAVNTSDLTCARKKIHIVSHVANLDAAVARKRLKNASFVVSPADVRAVSAARAANRPERPGRRGPGGEAHPQHHIVSCTLAAGTFHELPKGPVHLPQT